MLNIIVHAAISFAMRLLFSNLAFVLQLGLALTVWYLFKDDIFGALSGLKSSLDSLPFIGRLTSDINPTLIKPNWEDYGL